MDHHFTISPRGILTRYDGPGGDVTVPEGVVRIGEKAFWGCKAITSVTIPKGVTAIGPRAFVGCSALESVTFPESLIKIADSAFCNCSALKRADLPENMKELGKEAFMFCNALEAVTLPKNLISIEKGTFFNCNALTSVTIPRQVGRIEDEAFMNCLRLERVVIEPNDWWSVTIAGRAFALCPALKELSLPKNLYLIGGRAFMKDTSLKTVDIPEGVSILGEAFYGCSALEEITMPKGTEYLDFGLFSGCKNLKRVRLPEGVWKLKSFVFRDCDALEELVLPESVREIGRAVFPASRCVRVRLAGENPNFYIENHALMHRDGTLMELIENVCGTYAVSADVKKINDHAFAGASGIQRVIVPEGVTEIGMSAFAGMENLARAVFPRSLEKIGFCALSGCPALVRVEIPGTVDLSSGLFDNVVGGRHFGFDAPNAALLAPNIPWDSIPSDVRRQAVVGYACLCQENAEIPEETRAAYLKYIRSQRKRLYETAVKVPALLALMVRERVIPDEDFENVWDLAAEERNGEINAMLLEYRNKHVKPRDMMKELEKEEKTVERLLAARESGIYSIALAKKEWRFQKSVKKDGVILTKYLGEEPDVMIPREIGKQPVVKLGDSAFWKCTSLRSVTVPEGVKALGNHTFYGCAALRRADLPQTLTAIGFGCFEGCGSLERLTLPAGLEPGDRSPFQKCLRLTLYAPAGSPVEAWAKKEGIPFEALEA